MSRLSLSLRKKTRKKMMTTSVWNILSLTMMKIKKTKMLLEQQLLLKYQQKKSEAGDNTSIHSRGKPRSRKRREENSKEVLERDEEDMESQNSDENDEQMDAVGSRKTNYICFKPLMYYNKHLDRYYYFRYLNLTSLIIDC